MVSKFGPDYYTIKTPTDYLKLDNQDDDLPIDSEN